MTAPSRPAPDDWLLAPLEEILTKAQLSEVRSQTQGTHWEYVVQRGFTTDADVLALLAKRFRLKVADLGKAMPQAQAAVSESLARRYRIVPLAITDSTIDIATANPHDLDCERALEFAVGRDVRMSLAVPREIDAKLDELYSPDVAIEKILGEDFGDVEDMEAVAEEHEADVELSLGKATDQPIIRLVNRIVAKAIQKRSSDIHLEPEEKGVAIRYRIDGVLTQDSVIPRALGTPLVARVKIMAELDIADRLRPQDGRARFVVAGNRVDLRISTLPAAHGEKVVIRILDSRSTVLSLDALGLNASEIERMQTMLAAREGLVLVTGPTGSGKTTLLYSMIRQIQKRGVNIVTVEDPVEYRLQGIVQVQINEKTGLTFPAALRSILRQDPDVILVGEIRDRETANIAVQAALTGHLVLSTLHTIDAPSSITRITDIGIEPYKVAAALKGIVAQRLVRRLCTECRRQSSPGSTPHVPESAVVYEPVGCQSCGGTGYRGRLGICEVLLADAEVERRISTNAPVDRIASAARRAGMLSLWESGVEHVMKGDTAIAELTRVLEAPPPNVSRTAVLTPPTDRPSVPERAQPAPHSAGRSATGEQRAVDGPRRDPRTPRAGTLHAVPPPARFDGAAFDLLDEPASPPVTGGRSILLVEDEAPLRVVLRDLLERSGFEVHEAPDGVDAIDLIDRAAPDVIVLDLNLPRLDGFGVLKHLRSRPGTKDIPVIVLTAKGDEESEARVFEFGATGFITKPFRPRALIARLNALVDD